MGKGVAHGFAIGCWICAVIWQIVVVVIICTGGKLKSNNWLVAQVQAVIDEKNMIPDNLLKSWNTEPFIDIIVVDIDSASDSS